MDRRIKFILRYLEENSEKKITLTAISKMVNLNYSYLSELFIKEVGISFSSYSKKNRFKRATKLLRESFLSIKEISFDIGFKHVSSFCNEFKKSMGMTPSEFRNKTKINYDFKKYLD